MSIFVNTNTAALNAQRNLFSSSSELNKSYERLSSGFRINSAADDAAGMQIAERITSQVQGLSQSVRNANDAISLSQTAEGALNETTTALQRIRQLAIQAQNGINSSADRSALQKEVKALILEISRIATDTKFNGTKILTGGFSAKFMVGANAGQSISVNLSKKNISGMDGFSATGLKLNDQKVDTADNASAMIGKVDSALSSILQMRGGLGALENRFQSTIRNLSNVNENLQAARSRVQDTDFAVETSNLTRNQIIQQASLSILAQANQSPQTALLLLG